MLNIGKFPDYYEVRSDVDLIQVLSDESRAEWAAGEGEATCFFMSFLRDHMAAYLTRAGRKKEDPSGDYLKVHNYMLRLLRECEFTTCSEEGLFKVFSDMYWKFINIPTMRGAHRLVGFSHILNKNDAAFLHVLLSAKHPLIWYAAYLGWAKKQLASTPMGSSLYKEVESLLSVQTVSTQRTSALIRHAIMMSFDNSNEETTEIGKTFILPVSVSQETTQLAMVKTFRVGLFKAAQSFTTFSDRGSFLSLLVDVGEESYPYSTHLIEWAGADVEAAGYSKTDIPFGMVEITGGGRLFIQASHPHEQPLFSSVFDLITKHFNPLSLCIVPTAAGGDCK
jgi:hypothetical protein